MLEHRLDMFFPGLGKDQDVIQVDGDEAAEHDSEHIIHKSLEDDRGIGEAEGHYEGFIMPHRSVECRLPLVLLSDADQVISVTKVQADDEDGGPLKQFKSR